MYLHFFLLLFSSGVSSYFLPLKEMLHLEKKAQCAIIEEMICLLKAENETLNMMLPIPCHIMDKDCAYNNTEIFIKGLNQMHKHECMKEVEVKMKKLQDKCPILKEPSSHCKCSGKVKKKFSCFKESLEEFLRWVNENQNCSSIIRNDSGLHQDGKCTCPKPGKYHKGLL